VNAFLFWNKGTVFFCFITVLYAKMLLKAKKWIDKTHIQYLKKIISTLCNKNEVFV